MDPYLLAYVAKKAGVGVQARTVCVRVFLKTMREQLQQNVMDVMWDPTGRQQRIVQAKMRELNSAAQDKLDQFKQMHRDLEAQWRQERSKAARTKDQRLVSLQRERQAIWGQVAANQFELVGVERGWQLAQKRAEHNQALEQMLRDLSREPLDVVAEKLQDEQPVVRWLAALVTHRRRLPLERDLLDRLTDPHVQVREAARQALVKLSRGNDFGPAPNATSAQLVQAQRAWLHWLAMQDLPGRAITVPSRPTVAVETPSKK
ncbi:MAG: hypothetical protein L0Z62_50865 [Gemmataceae bacterium]|nr:hypothetical protein [Gemmataceae bacterium]